VAGCHNHAEHYGEGNKSHWLVLDAEQPC
jgi:hypothetical protein